MQLHHYFLLGSYIILSHFIFHNFTHAKALIGNGVRAAAAQEFPFVCAIVKKVPTALTTREHLKCSGSVITKDYVLTVDHCVEDEELNYIQVVIGNIDINVGVRYNAFWWLTYEQWSYLSGTFTGYNSNDLAMIKLATALPDTFVVGALLYTPWYQIINAAAVSVGWGELNNLTKPNTLHTVGLKVISRSSCTTKAKDLDPNATFYLPETYLCSVGNPIAALMPGDLGGPLLISNSIVGVNTASCPKTGYRGDPNKVNLHVQMAMYQAYITNMFTM